MNEEHGAGEEGTKKLRKKYQKDTPCQPVTEEEGAAPSTNTGNSVPAPGALKLKKTALFQDITDKRYKKDKPPVVLKRFKKFVGGDTNK